MQSTTIIHYGIIFRMHANYSLIQYFHNNEILIISKFLKPQEVIICIATKEHVYEILDYSYIIQMMCQCS